MKVIGLITSTRPEKLKLMLDSLSDCDDVIVVEDKERKGMAWARNKLMYLAPANSIVRFVDDDDVAFSTRRMAERLIENNLDVVTASYIVQNHRVEVANCPISACVNMIGPWSWVAKIESIRDIEWDLSKKVMTGTWHWLKFIDRGLKLGTAPDIWCYHWVPATDGVTAQFASVPAFDLYDELLKLIETKGSVSNVRYLADRISYFQQDTLGKYSLSYRYKDMLKPEHTDDMLYHKVKTYIKTKGEYMIGYKNNALSTEQCADIIQAATNAKFAKAAVRGADGSSLYNETHRNSSVSFIEPNNLAPETWNAILRCLTELNEQHYKADINEYNMQVAQYEEGQTGFDWHSDDPPYPTPGLLWSGRKLTYVFELSEAITYDGGYLDVEPYRVPKNADASANVFGFNLNMHASDVPNRITIYTQEPSHEVTSDMILNQSPHISDDKKPQMGDCKVFPSFFYHKVHPVRRGKRLSLTVWAKGPKWV